MMSVMLSVAVFALAILGMGLGALLGRGPLKGSCGGNSVLKQCGLCSHGLGLASEADLSTGSEETS